MKILYLLSGFGFYFLSISIEMSCSSQCSGGMCESEMMLGLLRSVPEIDFPAVSHDDQLRECQKSATEKSTAHTNSMKKLVEDSKNEKIKLDEITSKMIKNQGDHQKALDTKISDNKKLQQELATKETILNRQFDCKPNSFTIKKCRKFCTFPYSYDSCKDNSAKLEFIHILEDKEGRCIHSSYKNSAGSTCDEIHVVVS